MVADCVFFLLKIKSPCIVYIQTHTYIYILIQYILIPNINYIIKIYTETSCNNTVDFRQFTIFIMVVGQNVERQNVDRQNVDRQNAEQTKCRKFFYFFFSIFLLFFLISKNKK